MQGDRPCPRCGQLIPVGHAECPLCARPQGWWKAERDTLLLLSIVALVILFAITGIAANFYHAGRESLAQEWYARGVIDFKEKNASAALEDFRTALAYSPDPSSDTPIYRLHLAQALVAVGQVEEARSHLLTLWRDEPGNSTVNLELARLAAQRGDAADALRYYHNAIYGVWPSDPGAHRLRTRVELSTYLLAQRKKAAAQSELIALEAELPRDAALYTQVAGMLREAGDRNRALGAYRQALEIDRHQHEALIGAGESAFEMGDYQSAVDYLQRAARAGPASERVHDDLSTARMVLNLDPMLPRLSRAEADQRTLRDIEFAAARLDDCRKSLALAPPEGPAADDLRKLSDLAEKLKPSASTSALRQNPDLRVNLMDFVSNVEETTAKVCGNPSGVDWALLLIARKQGTTER
ncbi:MAG TPA: tetratricopeptide repeat protein [Terriglobia bacterium]|nr:tetratricopeptide repeat protein [Terriglobia bacterium]